MSDLINGFLTHLGRDDRTILIYYFAQSGHNYFAFPYFTVRLLAGKKSKEKSPTLHRMQMDAMSGQGRGRTIVFVAEKWALVRCQDSARVSKEDKSHIFSFK